MAEERNHYQIARKDAKNCFVESLNDCFSIIYAYVGDFHVT